MQSLIQAWAGEAIVVSHDHPTDTWIFIAIHSTTLGPAMGGCRMKVYDRPESGLRDAMRLAEGMTHKWAVIGFDLGGGKSVLAVPRPLVGQDRVGLLRRFGRLLESLNGSFMTGEDLGTTPGDMAILAQETRYVHGVDRHNGRAIDPGPFTALGVFVGMRAAVRCASEDGLRGQRVLIQGVGDVGAPLARLLAEAGATLLVSDLDARRASTLAGEVGAEVVTPDRVYRTPCDVFAPCAVGSVLNRETIPTLECRLVAGSANNQLGEAADANRLHARGILYAPDYVVNAGGAIALPMLGQGRSEGQVNARIQKIESTLDEIFAEAKERGETPLAAAARRVERTLAAKKREE